MIGRRIVGDGLEDPGVVDQHVDPPVQGLQRPVPEGVRGGRIGEIRAQDAGTVSAPVADEPDAAVAEGACDGGADAARGAGDEDMGLVAHAILLARAPFVANGVAERGRRCA